MKIFKSYTELFCKIFIFHTVHLFIGIWTFWVLVSCVWVLVSCVQLFCDPVDCSLPGSSIHEISQARMLEWVVLSFSRGASWPRVQTWVSRFWGIKFHYRSEHPSLWVQRTQWDPDLGKWYRTVSPTHISILFNEYKFHSHSGMSSEPLLLSPFERLESQSL